MRSIGIRLTLSALFMAVAAQSFAADAKRPTAKEGKPDGAALYHNYCSVCHGDRGDGNSRASRSLNPPPKDFTKITNLTRDYMVAIVKEGKAGTAMAGWSTQLSAAETAAVVDYVMDTFVRLATDPKLLRGRAIYQDKCALCHGEKGAGVTNAAIGMATPPRDLSTPQARAELSRARILDSVTHGRSGTAMISFRDQLKKQDIEAVVDYVRAAIMIPESSISGTSAHAGRDGKISAPSGPTADMAQPFPGGLKGDAAWGKTFYMANCATCHGSKGDGQGPRAYFINPRPANFIDDKYRSLNRPTLYTIIAAGKLGTEMPAWRHVLTEQQMANVAEYVFKAYIAPQQAKQTKSGK